MCVDVCLCVCFLQMGKPACTFFHLKPALARIAFPELRINYLGGISGLVAGNIIPIGSLISCVTWRAVPCFLISNFIQMWLGVRAERWESHTEVKRAKGETQGITFFKSSNVDCLNISSSLHGPHISAGRIHYKKQEREKIL